MIPKHKPIRLPNLLKAAKDSPCQACGADDGTIVAAHGPKSLCGGGMGTKPSDFTAFLCAECHDIVDGRRLMTWEPHERAELWTRALIRTLEHCYREGVLR